VRKEQLDLMEKVAAALSRGQFDFTAEELNVAFEQVWEAKVARAELARLDEGNVDLGLVDGKIVFVARMAI
jgi:hypothetical protein